MNFKKGDKVVYYRHKYEADNMFFTLGKKYRIVRVMGSWIELDQGPHEKPYVHVDSLRLPLLKRLFGGA